jgi:hypothetical protein
MAKRERAYGEIPDWAKQGPIDLANYSFRAELHCRDRSKDRTGAHPTIVRGTEEFRVWREYFEKHLRGYPRVMQLMLENPQDRREMTVPEKWPQWFDPSFKPDPKYVEPEYHPAVRPALLRPAIPIGADYASMVKVYGRPIGRFEHPDDQWNRPHRRLPPAPTPATE